MQEKQDTIQQVEISSTEAGSLAKVSNSEKTPDEFQDIKNQVLETFSELPAIITGFFGQYQKPIITLGIIVALIVTFKVTLAVVESLNDIPLLAPTFELIGIIYSIWFIYRYLLRASSRQELSAEIQVWKDQILGNNPSDS
ncbi:MAG: CAAD domain-containing protein [Trichodesmium sp. St18_bin1]|nr:CAAD domain-containing protein [Trichodesmium sp. St18_bin1]MDE5118740.1 CAAD domain-containing protein [Trichodesmium sp. St19_bin1]